MCGIYVSKYLSNFSVSVLMVKKGDSVTVFRESNCLISFVENFWNVSLGSSLRPELKIDGKAHLLHVLQ